MEEKELLRKLGEETIYTAKGHFKACDIRRILITYTIWFCMGLNLIGIIGVSPSFDKCLSAIGLFGTIALLLWNEGEGKDYRNRHKQIAEQYLALHKEIRSYYFLESGNKEQVNRINQKVIDLDQSQKPEIPWIARKLAQRAIKKSGETDNWFNN